MWPQGQWEASKKTAPDGANRQTDRRTWRLSDQLGPEGPSWWKWYTVRIRTWLEMYGQIYPFTFRLSIGLCPRELFQAKGYIWPYNLCLVLLRTGSCKHPLFIKGSPAKGQDHPLKQYTSHGKSEYEMLFFSCWKCYFQRGLIYWHFNENFLFITDNFTIRYNSVVAFRPEMRKSKKH